MRKVFLLLVVTVLAGVASILFYLRKGEPSSGKPPATSKATIPPTDRKEEQLTVGPVKNGYTFDWIIVKDARKISLQSNLEEKLGSKEAKNKNGCSYLVSGGFYTKEGDHSGLFISEGKKLSESKANSTYNGYFSIDYEGKAQISKSEPSSARVALQSGPVVMFNGKVSSLSIKNDKPARRMVAAVTRLNHVVFISVYKKGSVFSGPLLSELPSLIKKLNDKTYLEIVDAINLDGGTASAFISYKVNLSELTKIGSFFCIKEALIIN